MPGLILLFVVGLPIAWIVSEFTANRGPRIALGVCAIAMSFGVAWMVGTLARLRSNVYYSEATKDMIQNTIIELEKGKEDVVIGALRELRTEFRPTYETRDDYAVLVNKYIHSISDEPIQHAGGDPRWSHEIDEPAPTSPGVPPEEAESTAREKQ